MNSFLLLIVYCCSELVESYKIPDLFRYHAYCPLPGIADILLCMDRSFHFCSTGNEFEEQEAPP